MSRWERSSALAGVAAVLLWFAGLIAAGEGPDRDAPPQAYADRFENDDVGVLLGGFVFLLGVALFIWFLGTLRTALLAREGQPAHWTAVAFAGGLATAVLLAGTVAPEMAGALAFERDGTLDPAAAQALGVLGDGFFAAATVVGALFVAAVAFLALRTGALPAWFGWASAALAIVMLIPPIGWAGLAFGFPLWLVVASVLFWRGTERTRPPVAGETREATATPPGL